IYTMSNTLSLLDALPIFSKGVKLPSQIPVKTATEIMLEEKKQQDEKIDNIVKTVNNDKSSKGAEEFKKVSSDLKRSVTALASYSKWNENETAFVKFVSLNPEAKGFGAAMSSVSSEELNILFLYLKGLF
ncbi:MAG: hypothetical protein LWX07_12960, partial [Bacteroidetes bacterium]|nr:hypothetical protein [Bacteroidota bacterium]